MSSSVHGNQEWELFPYLSQAPLAFHHLFATSAAQAAHYSGSRFADDETEEGVELSQFLGPNAAWHANETMKTNSALLSELHGGLNIPLTRMYKSTDAIATELLPYVLRILSPDVKPVIINTSTGGTDNMRSKNNVSAASVRKASEKEMVLRSVNAMLATGIQFERARVELDDMESRASGGWVFRMQPPLDSLGVFETLPNAEGKSGGNRYGVRSVISTEYIKEKSRTEEETRRRRVTGEVDEEHIEQQTEVVTQEDKDKKKLQVKRDFFGRPIAVPVNENPSGDDAEQAEKKDITGPEVWITFHEGYSNAVRKPITLRELMSGL